MKIILDQFTITIEPTDKTNTLDILTGLLESPAVQNIIAGIYGVPDKPPCGCHDTAPAIPELTDLDIQFINELALVVLDPDTVIPFQRTDNINEMSVNESIFEPFYLAPQWGIVSAFARNTIAIDDKAIQTLIQMKPELFQDAYLLYNSNIERGQKQIADFLAFVRTL